MSSLESTRQAPTSVSATFVPDARTADLPFPGSLTTTFTGTGGQGTGPFARVLDQVEEDLGQKLEDLEAELRAADPKVLGWLARSPKNVERFVMDPIGALRKSGCGVPSSLLDRLEAIGSRLGEHFPPLPGQRPESASARVVATTEPVASAPQVSLNTQGWDLIAAVNQKTLNALLADLFSAGKIPNHINRPVTIFGVSGVVELEFAAPEIGLDAVLKNGATITFPVTGGSITVGTNKTTIAAGSSIAVTTALKYVDLEIEGQAVRRLSFDFTSPNAVYNVNAKGFPFPAVVAFALKAELEAMLPATYYVGDVNLASVPEELRPTGTAEFSTQAAGTADDNALLLLMTTASGTPGTATDFTTRPPVIPAGNVSSFTVSNRLLISQIVVPQVAKGLKTTASNFAFSGSPETASLQQMVDLAGKYHTTLNGLDIGVIDGGGIELRYDTRNRPVINSKDAFYIEVKGTAIITPALVTADGQQLIDFNQTISKPKGKLVAKWWAWGALAAAIIATFGSLLLFYGLVAAIVIPAILANIDFKLPNGQSLVGNVLQSGLKAFRWPLQDLYPLTSIALPGDLIVSGTPKLSAVGAPLVFAADELDRTDLVPAVAADTPLLGATVPLLVA